MALARLTRPYKTRTVLSVFSLLLATATALAPPFLSKYASTTAPSAATWRKLSWIVGVFLLAGLLNWGMSYVQTYLTGWVGERILADLGTGSSTICSASRSASSSGTGRA